MKRFLLSWIATKNDFLFEGGIRQVNESGPTLSYHRHFYGDVYEKHLILSQASEEDVGMDFLLNYLKRTFPKHQVEGYYTGLLDVIDLEQIRSKIEPLLLSLAPRAVDIYLSPGTPAMHTAWVLAHMTLGIDTRLIQVRPSRFTPEGFGPEQLVVTVDKDATTSSAIIRENRSSQFPVGESFVLTESIVQVYEKAQKVAQAVNSTVLILGETGTGKEHLARFIHEQSPRRSAPFAPINCSALGDELLESRLFGYKKGSFTGAFEDKEGILQQSAGGTVFLDEIGDISPYMQQVLLRVLQEKEIRPIGGQVQQIDIRFIAATNRNLLELCQQERFRWDLYYRLAIVDLELPRLSSRGRIEVEALVQHFVLQKQRIFNQAHPLHIGKKAMECILDYPFPGNVRELENLIERLYVLYPDQEVQVSDLPQRFRQDTLQRSLKMNDIEKAHIQYVLDLKNGKQRQTALALGIAYNTLMRKIETYGIDLERYRR